MNTSAFPLCGAGSGAATTPDVTNVAPVTLKHVKMHDAEVADVVRRKVKLVDGALWWVKTNRPVKGYMDRGYHRFTLSIAGRSLHFSTARVIWLLHHGAWPQFEIDHANRIKTDNRIENLRDATRSENERNKARAPRTITGVRFRNGGGHWEARIWVDCQYIHLGCFRDQESAVAARLAGEERYLLPPGSPANLLLAAP